MRKERDMLLEMGKLTKEEIKENAREVANGHGFRIAHLQNNGLENFEWNMADFESVMQSDIFQ